MKKLWLPGLLAVGLLGSANLALAGEAAPDNTGVNERDRSGETLTPLDQGNSESELRITQTIRKAVMADEVLSMNAKNVKIITVGSVVTLRGPVDGEGESKAIEAKAKSVAGVTRVDNQLEIERPAVGSNKEDK